MKGGKKQQQQESKKGGCSAHAHGEQVYGGINSQHASTADGNMIAMNNITGGRKRRSRNVFGKMRKFSMKMMGSLKSMGKSRRNRRSRRR